MRALALLVCAVSLTACGGGSVISGFTPLYAVTGVKAGLSSIEVVTPYGRNGFLLRQALEDTLATDRSAPPAYRLSLKVKQRRVQRGLRVDNIANRYEIQTDIAYTLLRLSDRKQLAADTVSVLVTADSADQPYAGIAAQANGDLRSAEEGARRIATQLGIYFANPTEAANRTRKGPTADDVGMLSVGDRLSAQTLNGDEPDAEPEAQPDDIQRIP